MVAFSSLFSWPFALPSLPSISLPANIQRRFLSYVLKRALGRFVKTGGLDVDRIQAQISEGWVEIQGLEVDTEAINELLSPNLALTLTNGRIDNITAQVPFSNLWSDPLSITLDDLTLDFDLANTSPSSRASPRATSHQPLPSSPSVDLAQSVTSAADDFLHEELDAYEEAELGKSIRQSLILSQNDPFSSDDIPGGFPFSAPSSSGSPSSPMAPTTESKTALAGLVERILARLQVKVRNVRVRVRLVDKDHGATFELRIGEIQYSDESDGEETAAGKVVRGLRFSSVAIYTVASRPSPTPSRPPYATSTRSSSTSSTSSSTDGQAEMAMSYAVADLRQSTMSSIASGASVYHSALEEGDASEEDEEEAKRARSATPTANAPEPDVLLLSFGNEDVVLRMRTTPPTIRPPANPDSGQAAERPGLRRASTGHATDSLPLMQLEMTVGAVSAVLLPRQIASLLAAAQVATPKSTPQPTSVPSEGVQPRVEASFRVKGLYLAIVHDMAAASSALFQQSLDQFWAKPSITYLPVGHLKLRMEGLAGSYSSKGYIPSPAAPIRRTTGSTLSIHRRPSSSVHFGPRPPSVEATVSEISIFEYLATDSASSESEPQDAIPGGAYPVLIFDTNLLKQYDLRSPSSTRPSSGLIPPPLFPEYESVDWRNSGLQRRSGPGEKAWKVRSGIRGVLKGVSQPVVQDEGPAILIKAQIPSSGISSPATIHLQPLHIFLDLSLLERLLPLLRFIAPAIKSSPPPDRDVYAEIANSRRYNTTPAAPRSGQYVIDDLDAQAASVSTLRAQPQRSNLLEATCPLVRIDIRCPAPPNRRGTWGDGAHLRSGIVTLDLHQLTTKVGAGQAAGSGSKAGAGDMKVEWEKMIFFFCRVPEKRAQAFLVVGPLAPDAADPPDMMPLLPSVTITKSTNPAKLTSTSLVTCRIPSIQAKIRQSTIEGLQFFADDITHWLDGAFGDGSAPKPREDLKMIGSRFFGSKGSSSASSSAEEEEDDTNSATVLRLVVSEMDIALHVPRRKQEDAKDTERVLSLQASDVDVKVESNTTGKQETTLAVAIMDAEFSDRTDPATPIRILGRTTPLTLAVHNSPLASIRFSSLSDPITQTKETGIKVALTTLAVFITKDLAWVTELASFAKTPEGVFEDMTPAEVTRIALQLFDCSVHVSAPTMPGAIVAVLGVLDVKTDIVSDAEESVLDLSLTGGCIMAIDDMAAAAALQVGHSSSAEAWKRAGYASMIELDPVELQLFRELLGSKQMVLDVLRSHIRVTACADSLGTLTALVGDLPHLVPSKSKADDVPTKSPTELDQSVNVFGSIDEDTFRRLPDPNSGMDLIEDDLPNNLDYLDSTARRSKRDASGDTIEGLRSWQTEYDDHLGGDHLAAEINGETIKILVQEVFEYEEDYWENLPTLQDGLADKMGPIKVRFHDVSAEILLYDGFDWLRTRKAIEEEIRAVRRRLERIKQLLASGQKADDSVERASSTLFNSVYIGLDQSKEGMDTAALIAAIDVELEGLGDETASQSSWQTMPAVGTERPSAKKTRLRGKRITRSKKAQIEFALTGVKADIDLFGPTDEISGRIHITAKSLEILDHIKTSTWKKFLSEMRADSRGNIRETGADMLRLELTSVRPSLPHPDEELRLKVLPLRLHIDQDALDFLKRFFSFQMPSSGPPPEKSVSVDPSTAAKGKELFFQHVEIFPVEIKLDYKPKRVDFAALREGKTIELMNFFHFDGAEMTLRHITMSGVSGLTRLSSMLQDIWTPDVKANQLADVISGVSPIRSMVNVGSGVADLILLPIEQYRKDGRVARGVQRGTSSFVRSTAMEMMKLGAKLATGTQVILERAEGVLGGGSKFREDVVGEVGGGAGAAAYAETAESDDEGEMVDVVSRYANQPTDAREGVQAAYKSLSTNINSAAQTILAVPMEVYERSGDNGPLKAVVRAVPIAVLRPMIGASEAVSKTLLGVRNSLDPTSREELGDKYK